MVIAPKSDARTPAHGRAGCAHSKSFAKQKTPTGEFCTKCFRSAMSPRLAFTSMSLQNASRYEEER